MWPTKGVYKNFAFSQKFAGVGCADEPGLSGVGYTRESGLTDVAYNHESLIQPSRPGNALKGTIPQKSDCECQVLVIGKRFLCEKISDLTHSD